MGPGVITFHGRGQGVQCMYTPQGEKKKWGGAEFMGVSCKSITPGRGAEESHFY